MIAAIAFAWFLTGAAAVALMRHRGHDAFSWAIVFLALGPLALPLAVSADRHRPSEPPRPLPPGGFDVLVAHDGSADATAAMESALELVGPSLTSVTLAAVVDLEAPTTVRGRETERATRARLEVVAQQLAASKDVPVGTVVLYGEPGHALQHFAIEHGYELIVAGSATAERSHLWSHRLARSLRHGSVPVLVGPASP